MKRIFILTDLRGWALDHVFQAVRPMLETQFDITYRAVEEIAPRGLLAHLPGHLSAVFSSRARKELFRSFDGVFVLWSCLLGHLDGETRERAGCGVHCHFEFTDNRSPGSLAATLERPSQAFLDLVGENRLTASPSRRLVSILRAHGLRARLIPNSVDPCVFYPMPVQRAPTRLRVGWCQSETNHGFKRRIAEIQRVCDSLPEVELVRIPRDQPITDRNELRKWYSTLDCYVCFSICEGGPMPVLEAMACGVPCLSTPVGHVPEVIEHGTNGWIVNTEHELRFTLKCLASDRMLLANAGKQAHETILASRTPASIAPYWRNFIDELTSEV